MSTITREQLHERAREKVKSLEFAVTQTAFAYSRAELEEELELARIALASLEAEPVITVGDDGGDALAYRRLIQTFAPGTKLYTAPPVPENAEPVAWLWSHRKHPSEVTLVRPEDDERAEGAHWSGWSCQALYAAPTAQVSVPESEPVAYIFKHPAGRLFWSLTDESNKWQSDVMPVYSAPVLAFVPPAIEPDYEVIKGILPTANPDEYACCIAADMWNACRAAMLQGADGNSPVIPGGWVMVPAEPTAEMLQSGISAHYERSQIQIHDRPAPGPMECAYVAMLAAAPKQEVK